MIRPTKIHAKKLLVAAVGVASVNYVASGCSSGGPAASDAGTQHLSVDGGSDAFIVSGNLAPPLDASAPPSDAASNDRGDVFIVSGNLALPPHDAGGTPDAGDAGDP